MMTSTRETAVKGCLEILFNRFEDKRGDLVKIFNSEEYTETGVITDFREELLVKSFKNVIRGMHFQLPPELQAKQVYCIAGKIIDVIFDLRKDSPSYMKYDMIELSPAKNSMLYVQPGVAQGYCVLEDNSMVLYRISGASFSKEHDSGLRWDSLGIPWPIDNPIISDRDIALRPLSDFDSPFSFSLQNCGM